MTQVEQLANVIVRASFSDMSGFALQELKTRVLDALGCALGAIHNELVRVVKEQVEDFGGRNQCTLIGGGGTAPDRAAFYNCALLRYLDL